MGLKTVHMELKVNRTAAFKWNHMTGAKKTNIFESNLCIKLAIMYVYVIFVYLCPSGTGGKLMWDGMWRSLITGYAWTGTSKFSSPWNKNTDHSHHEHYQHSLYVNKQQTRTRSHLTVNSDVITKITPLVRMKGYGNGVRETRDQSTLQLEQRQQLSDMLNIVQINVM